MAFYCESGIIQPGMWDQRRNDHFQASHPSEEYRPTHEYLTEIKTVHVYKVGWPHSYVRSQHTAAFMHNQSERLSVS